MIFGAPDPKLMIFGPQISPFLPTRASHNDRNQSKYALTGLNQTYLPITTLFGANRLVFGKLLSVFGAPAPKLMIFGPQISPFSPTGALYNDRNHSNYAVTPWH